MGFKVPRRKLQISFDEGHEYFGAEVELTLDMPIGLMFDMRTLEADDPEEATRLFADQVLASWNLEDDDGEPIPPDYQGARTVPSAFMTTLMKRWSEEATTVPAPLDQTSSATDLLVVQSTGTGT